MAKRQSIAAVAPDFGMGVLDAIGKRHSVRSFTRQPVDKATIHTLLRAAVRAPTAMHEEPWAFAVIQDEATLKRLSDRAKEMMGAERGLHAPGRHRSSRFAPPENIFYEANTLIVICGEPVSDYVVADCWLAAENLMLAAVAMGLGTCVIGLAIPALNSPEWKAELGIAPEMIAHAPIIVGTPGEEASPTSRKEPRILSRP